MSIDKAYDILGQLIENQRLAKAAADREISEASKGGVPWWEAPIPRRWHRCWAQTRMRGVERCACGALRYQGDPPFLGWLRKNERRRGK